MHLSFIAYHNQFSNCSLVIIQAKCSFVKGFTRFFLNIYGFFVKERVLFTLLERIFAFFRRFLSEINNGLFFRYFLKMRLFFNVIYDIIIYN